MGSFEISRAGIYPKYPEETVLFPVYSTRQRNFALYVTGVIFTCKYFKFGLNTPGLSQSHFRNLTTCSINTVILEIFLSLEHFCCLLSTPHFAKLSGSKILIESKNFSVKSLPEITPYFYFQFFFFWLKIVKYEALLSLRGGNKSGFHSKNTLFPIR